MLNTFVGRVIDNVKIEEQILKGSGKVFIGKDQITLEKVIVKIVDTRGAENSVFKGMEAAMKVGFSISKTCMFLVKIREVVNHVDYMVIIMEYCAGGDLSSLIFEHQSKDFRFTDDNVLEIAFQLAKAVEALHDGDIVHRDLKPDNVFLLKKDFNNFILKLGDFGISRIIDSTKTTMVMGSIGYTPPEVLDGQAYSKAGDVYSLGVILVELIDLLHPFMNAQKIVQQSRIFTGCTNITRTGLSSVQRTLRELALRMMSVDPSLRPSISNVLAFTLFTPFFQQFYLKVKEKDISQTAQIALLTTEIQSLRKQLVEVKLPSSSSPSSSSASSSPLVVLSPCASTPVDIEVKYIKNPSGGYSIDVHKTVKFIGTNLEWRTLFFNHEIVEGIVKCEMKVTFERQDFFMFGIASKNKIDTLHTKNYANVSESCGCYFSGHVNLCVGGSMLFGVQSSSIRSGVVIGIEVDMNDRTVCFFFDGVKQANLTVNGLPSTSLHIGVSLACVTTAFWFVSYRKLRVPTESSVIPIYKQWK